MNERRELQQQIENVRAEMHRMAEKMGFLAAEVLEKSKQLDELLNRYNRMRAGHEKY